MLRLNLVLTYGIPPEFRYKGWVSPWHYTVDQGYYLWGTHFKCYGRGILKKNLNACRPSEHPSVSGKDVKTFSRWDHKLQIPKPLNGIQTRCSPMVVTLGQQYITGEKPTVMLYTYINRHAGTPDKKKTKTF